MAMAVPLTFEQTRKTLEGHLLRRPSFEPKDLEKFIHSSVLADPVDEYHFLREQYAEQERATFCQSDANGKREIQYSIEKCLNTPRGQAIRAREKDYIIDHRYFGGQPKSTATKVDLLSAIENEIEKSTDDDILEIEKSSSINMRQLVFPVIPAPQAPIGNRYTENNRSLRKKYYFEEMYDIDGLAKSIFDSNKSHAEQSSSVALEVLVPQESKSSSEISGSNLGTDMPIRESNAPNRRLSPELAKKIQYGVELPKMERQYNQVTYKRGKKPHSIVLREMSDYISGQLPRFLKDIKHRSTKVVV